MSSIIHDMTRSPSKLVAADAFYHCSGAQIQAIGELCCGDCFFFNNPGNNEKEDNWSVFVRT